MSNTFTLYAELDGKQIPVLVTKRKVKRFIMRLDRTTGNPVVSAPRLSTVKETQKFIDSCEPWLRKNYSGRTFFTFPEALSEGDEVLLLGKYLPIHIEKGNKAALIVSAEKVVLKGRNLENPSVAASAYERALRDYSLSLYEEILNRYSYVIPGKYSLPKITVKAMSSRWGSAVPSAESINLSLYLIKTPMRCIESVVLHEATHFVYLDHSTAFYNEIRKNMPDYDVRHRELNSFAKTYL